jgi:cell division protein FtsL
MRHWLLGISVLLALGSAFALYGIDYATRRLENRVIMLERATAAADAQITALKAERAHLARPERIEPLARALGMAPPGVRQFLTVEQLAAEMLPPASAAPTRIEDLLGRPDTVAQQPSRGAP